MSHGPTTITPWSRTLVYRSLLYDKFRSHLESGRKGEALDVMAVAGFTAKRMGLGKAKSTLMSRSPFGVLDSPEPVSEEYLQELRDESRADELAGKLMLRFLVDSIKPLADFPYVQDGASWIMAAIYWGTRATASRH